MCLRRLLLPIICACVLSLSARSPARAMGARIVAPIVADGPGALCRTAIASAEASEHIPDAFLSAIARVESGRTDPASGALISWPWTVNAEGTGSFYATKTEALSAVRALQARGVRSIDVGCMQVNLLQHADAFTSLEQAFDPAANAAYAGSFLVSLFGQTGSWPRAAAAYHSQTPTIGSAYQKRVLAEWAEPAGIPAAARQRNKARGTGQSLALGAAPPEQAAPVAGAPPVRGSLAALPMSSMGRAFMAWQPAHMMIGTGRNLAAYRTMPTRLAFQRPATPG